MPFADGGQIASGGSTANNQTNLTVATTAAVNAGELAVVCVCDDNVSTTTGDDLAVSGVTIGGTAMTKARQNAVTGGASQAGSSVSVWWLQAAANIASGVNIVASFTNSTASDATAMTARKFTLSGGGVVSVEGTNATTSATTNPGSLDVTTANHEVLRVRAIGCEFDSTQTLTNTASWTLWTEGASAASGTTTEQVIEVESRIVTGTTSASAPTLGSACDNASVHIAFQEDVGVLMGQAVL